MKFTAQNPKIALAALFLSTALLAQNPTPAPKQTKSILLTGLTIHVGNGKVIEHGMLGFKDGKIDMALDASVVRFKEGALKYDTTINMNGAHAYPGFFAPNSTLGLNEVESVRATNDFRDVPGYNPHIRALIAFNSDSKIIPTVRTNGILFSQATPRGGVISGTSSIMALDGWNWEDAAVKKDEGVHVNFPTTIQANGWWAEPQPATQNKKYDEQLNELKKFFADAKAYAGEQGQEEKNLRFEAMRGIFDGTKNLYIHADDEKDIIAAVNFANQFQVKKMVLVGAAQSWRVTKLLKQNNVAVMVNRVHSLPERQQDDIDLPYKLPYLLQKDSILFCLQNEGDMEGMNARNIPFLAGTARAYGLTNEQAVAAVSYNVAKIVGTDKQMGTIEEGKDASFFISTGDALDMKTNNVVMAFINGKKLALTNMQQQLYKTYQTKYQIK
ncbi:MAG TPA: amidohydrolase family protein [Bacteroidia bacterium]|nr:amidohydrolase family protein [Bacteroidia bacterium]